MIKDMPILDQLIFTTLRITCLKDKKPISTGTAFYFEYKIDGYNIPVIVTNKHVVKDSEDGKFEISLKDEKGDPINGQFKNIMIEDFSKAWILHPKEEVDLAILPYANFLKQMNDNKISPFYISISENHIPKEEELDNLNAVEEVLMVGYPIGLWDSKNNLPIVRSGITATAPYIDYEGKPIFLVDMACVPGSSGSPVFLYSNGAYQNKKGATVISGIRVMFLGILYAGPQMDAKGKIQAVEVPTEHKIISSTRIPINLGMVIKANELLEFKPILESRLDPAIKKNN